MIEKLKKLLIKHEGEVNHAYKDSEGYITIGVGRLIDPVKGGGLSHDEIMYLLDNDIVSTIKECDRAFFWYDDLTENRKVVILSMVFNMGLPKFKGFKKTIIYIEAEDYKEASIEMLDSKWAGQVGSRAVELSDMMREG